MNKIMTMSLSGYKALAETQELSISKLTILSGCNSGGKSSFMQVLLMMKQTIESSYSDGALLINGEHVKHNSVSQMMSVLNNGQKSKEIEFTLTMGKDVVTVKYNKNRRIGLVPYYIKIINKEFPDGLEISKGRKSPDFTDKLPSHLQEFISIFDGKGKWRVTNRKCFLELKWEPTERKGLGFSTGVAPSSRIEEVCKRLIHLPGLRGNPERMYKKMPVGNVFSGTFEKYTASVLSKWASTNSQKNKIEKLEEYLKLLGLCNFVETNRIDDTNFEILVSRLPVSKLSSKNALNNKVNIADVGFGVSQTLPILVALVAAKEGQIVYIEQPEIHLHPNAQWYFAQVVADSISRGIIVIIETHSSILIRGIQTLVAKGEIESGSDVSLHWFSRDTETGYAKISSCCLDELGAFGEWPADFDDVALKAEQEYLDAVEAHYA